MSNFFSMEADHLVPEGAGLPTDARARSVRSDMECIVLPAREGSPPSDRPPVEIFLGTEPAQYRANRVFVWSIEKVRDPGREVRVYFMSEMPGFDRRFWTTGFTNYRFALPALTGGHGRAIYNDEDQIYLTDPGVLFDLEMGDAGVLSISDRESSVMLVDCEKMAPIWTLSDAQHAWKRTLLGRATKELGVRGDLDPGWNARDEEFRPGQSHLLHYTTLHTQPWRPFPERFVYQKGSYTDLWHDLEREAIEAGFEPFSRAAPSKAFSKWMSRLRSLPVAENGSGIGLSGEVAGAVDGITRRTKSTTLVELTPDLRGDSEQCPGRFGLDTERRVGLLEWLGALDEDEPFDGVVCVDGLEDLPVWDIPWIIESFFARATRFVFAAVRCPESPPRRRFLFPPAGTTHTRDWWRSHFDAASRRHPEISWELMSARGNQIAADTARVSMGGPRPDATPPSVWTLSDRAPGNDAQVVALAHELGWPAQAVRPELSFVAAVPGLGQGAHLRGLAEPDRIGRTPREAWPDLLIVSGRRVAPVARWIRERAGGRTRVVALGAKAATPADFVDLAVTPRNVTLFPHPNRIEVDRPLVGAHRAPAEHGRWRERIEAIRGPRWIVSVGSGTRRLGLDSSGAEALGRLVSESAAGLGASIIVSASLRADPQIIEAILKGTGGVALVHRATRDQQTAERAWPALLATGDVFVMVGLGEVALAEITATGRPVFLAPQQDVRTPFVIRARDAIVQKIVERAEARPENDRGTPRPQEGIELYCAKLIERGWIRPRRDVETLRGRLVRNGRARLLRAPIRAGDLGGFADPVEPEVLRVADRVRSLLGVESVEESRS